MAITKVEFFVFYTMFLFAIIQITAMMGSDIITNAPTVPTIPAVPTAWDYLSYPFENIAYFFTLAALRSSFAIFGAIIITPFAIGVIWAVIELVRGI